MKKRKIMSLLLAGAMTAALLAAPAQAAETQQDGYLTNGKAVTEENVLEVLHQLEEEWPAWTPWGDPKLLPDTCKNDVSSAETGKIMRSYNVSNVYGCGAYASMISSRVFGDTVNPCRRLEDLTQIRPGDIIVRVHNATGRIWHVTVALESPNDLHGYHVTDGNHGGIVYWPDEDSQYSRENFDCYGEDKSYRLEVWTRYPEDVPFTGDSVNIWTTDKENECT